MKIAILGGSFDPPHLGHILIAQQVIEFCGIDQVWLMPNYSTAAHHAVFQKKLSPVENRFAMATLLEEKKIKASDFEIKNNKKSIAVITLELLSKKYPEHSFYWITGSDKLKTFHLYDRWQEIISKYHLIIFPREHMLWDLENRVKEALQVKTIPPHVTILQNKDLMLTNISSTAIRDRVKKGLPIDFLVPKRVAEYVKKNHLYKENQKNNDK
jgi:nicotinate-nucleotide adenylyltransferase